MHQDQVNSKPLATPTNSNRDGCNLPVITTEQSCRDILWYQHNFVRSDIPLPGADPGGAPRGAPPPFRRLNKIKWRPAKSDTFLWSSGPLPNIRLVTSNHQFPLIGSETCHKSKTICALRAPKCLFYWCNQNCCLLSLYKFMLRICAQYFIVVLVVLHL